MKFDAVFRSRRSNVMATRGMVATSQPLAAQAGLEILKAGGNAADAAVATAAMLNVVEPISTGIGGDCFALFWDARTKQVTALNGSGRAPAAASIEALRSLGYTKMPTFTGHAVSVPGTVAGWSDLLERHGTMSLADVLQPAIWTAEHGYPVSEIIATGWRSQVPKLLRSPDWESGDLDNGPEQPSGHELLIDGRAPRPGEIMRIPTLAETLRGIAAEGKDYIYRGEFAHKLSAHVQKYGGWITSEDMAAHESTWDEPIHADYRGVTLYECPPNGQGLAAIIAANLAAGFDLAAMEEVDRLHILIECMRLGFADAQRWVCDPRVVPIPLEELVSPAYAERRRQEIDLRRAAQHVPYGDPLAGSDTVYLSVVDGEGNACSFINSLYMGTGTGLVVPGTGVSLQNRAALFQLDPEHPNALAPHKRPYQTIIPALTTRGGELHACLGVMGGFMQPQGHLQMLVNLVDLGMWPQRALDVPRWQLAGPSGGLGAQESGGLVAMEEGWSFATLAELARRGHRLVPVDGFGRTGFGGGQIILRDPETGVLIGGSDPRKDGCAVGW
ncbi:gamma-glutamyltransferase family protein [Litorilinea aerophila]|uniref:Gamma-glutamyltransferase family protein n=1 Tax=Litorilinea aerophila TaxID=1204385 RepID=A0A540VFI8_9CHLR|nr:gamma-glutamyltransferase family protein [Litorilinea aerophila]MCC9076824.1 gamma-glutamyltransferase family protein [Litorilinea aerophila]